MTKMTMSYGMVVYRAGGGVSQREANGGISIHAAESPVELKRHVEPY